MTPNTPKRPSKEDIKTFAKESYINTSLTRDEDFEKDFEEIFITRKMISRFLVSEVINEKLILNKIVTTLNVFGKETTTALYRMICTDVQFSVAKAVLMFVGQYDYAIALDVYPNRIMVDILKDIQVRYNLEHVR